MTYKINPRAFDKDEDRRGWEEQYPTWVASKLEVATDNYVVPDHLPHISVTGSPDPTCISNICTHKQALILNGRGKLNNSIVCPVHRWAWDKDGTFKSAKGISTCKDLNLPKYKLDEWEGHLFIGPTDWKKDIDKLDELKQFLNIENYTYHSSHTLEYNFDWKIFFEIFLDLYHVKPFHPGLRSLTDCDTFDWTFGEGWSCQTALFNRNTPTEVNYYKLQQLHKQTGHFETAKYGAVWLGIYPNTMLEYYPGCYVVSTVWPNGKGKCINNLSFYYENGLLEKCPRFAEVQRASFMVTADEDEIIGNRIADGRKKLTTDIEFVNHPLEEAGTQHFYDWLQVNTKFLSY